MDVKEETCEADINTTKVTTVNFKKEDSEWENPPIKDEDYEVPAVDVKEEAEEKSVSSEMMKPKSEEPVNLNVSPGSLQSDTKRAEEMSSDRIQEDQTVPSNPSGENLQEICSPYPSSLPQTLLRNKPQLPDHDENLKTSGSGNLNRGSLQLRCLPIMKLTGIAIINSQKQIHNANAASLSKCQDVRKHYNHESKCRSDGCSHKKQKLPYCCSECGKQFSSSSHCNPHTRSYAGGMLYCCSECGKQFPDKKSLDMHTGIHSGERPYSCSECGKQFFYKKCLHNHALIHIEEKQFCCHRCNKRYCCQSSLHVHSRSHSGVKPYCCSECGKHFSQRAIFK
ncbi:oocyte zinc finger protein XlCOF7.1-like [Erpetoichthys calabaricus]|uniref:oocyte zinc finger protein XlCOF7.1-like n=1 Tax=Erpetoichthys calabaricus TaxID=27687 RepID=UPI0022341C98|nr:oocyte zinc finger protein XlCOF7.1-like [Erpetoichthys calabaricus]